MVHHRHQRKASGESNNASTIQTSPSRHARTHTAPSLLRIPSSSSGARGRRSTNPSNLGSPSTPTLTPSASQVSTSNTSPSYFSPQPASSGKDARSPTNRRPPASFSGHGIDNSRGPPIALITRGSADIARRSQQQKSTDFAFAQQQLFQSGLVSPGGTPRSASRQQGRRDVSTDSADRTPQPQPQPQPQPHTHTQTASQPPAFPRRNSAHSRRGEAHMASSTEDSSEYGAGLPSQHSQYGDTLAARQHHRAGVRSGTQGEQGEDLFLNIAQDSPPKGSGPDMPLVDRRRSRIARPGNRQSLPPGAIYSSPIQANPTTTPTGSTIPSAIDTKSSIQYRRSSLLASPSSVARSQREQSPISPANPLDSARSRQFGLSPQPSFSSSRSREPEQSPHLATAYGRRRQSAVEGAVQTPPNRNITFRPSNLHFSSSREPEATTPHVETPQELIHNATPSRANDTESLDSTGAPASVWDELDDLKSRIRKIELGGKIPATSNAVVSNGSGDRPRTANTSATTVSSSPKQYRKNSDSSAEPSANTPQAHKGHVLLREALTKVKQHASPAIYRALDSAASEAIALSEMSGGGGGPQGTLYSATSIIHGASMPDRQVRRKAENICRSLTELCIALCDTKSSIASPAVRTAVAGDSRRPSLQINGESPLIRTSIEHESGAVPPRSSPSRAMSRIEARRTSLAFAGGSREPSLEPTTPSQMQIPVRHSRANTSLRSRRTLEEDDEEDPTLRAPSRALTDFRDIRSTKPTTRGSREHTSREPLPELQPSAIPQSSLRRPTVTGIGSENTRFLFQDGSRRYLDRQSSPAIEKQVSTDRNSRVLQPSTQYTSNRHSFGGGGLGRTGSLTRRRNGGAGE